MDHFNIKTILQQKNWCTVFTVLKVYLILHIIYKLLTFIKGYLECRFILRTSPVPGVNTQLLYPYLLFCHYKKATPKYLVLCDAFEMLIGCCRLYGKDGLFGGHLLFKPSVYFFKAEAVEVLLGNSKLIDKNKEYKLLRPLLGSGLVTSQRTKWRKHRRLLTPTFHFSILEDCLPVFQNQANILISKIKSRIQEPWIDIVYMLNLCTLDIICQTAMGVSMNIQNEEHRDYSNALHNIFKTTMYRVFHPWLYNDTIFSLTAFGKKFYSNVRLVHEFNKKVLRQKMDDMVNKKDFNLTSDDSNEYLRKKVTRKPFLELILEHHLKDPSFTEEDVIDEMNTFMSAGHETTAKAISWVLYCLGLYPEVQRKVQEELDSLFTDEENVNISREVLSKMKYLECVIKETLRIYPAVVNFSRENDHDFKVLNYTVKKGTICNVLIWQLHRDPEVFPDPEKFIPERFFPENCAGRHPYAYIPFSAGPRNCIGQKFGMMEAKTVLACILKCLRVESLDPRDKILVYPNITIGNVDPLRLKFQHR